MREGESGTTSFRYGSYNPGSLRLIAREPLLFPESPMIEIIEWSNLKLETNPTNTRYRLNYAAISHVWKSSHDVNRIASEVNRPIRITIEDGSAHETGGGGGRTRSPLSGKRSRTGRGTGAAPRDASGA